MPHSFVRCWIHRVWVTKRRDPLIKPEIEELLYDKMKKEFFDAGCTGGIINGIPDHVHCLFRLNPVMSIADAIKWVKGGSSNWLNGEELLSSKFSWQTGYAAYSVSESQLARVYNYIKNQKKHHLNMTSQEELDRLNAYHGLIHVPRK